MPSDSLRPRLHHAWRLARRQPARFLFAAVHRFGRSAQRRFRRGFTGERAQRVFAARYGKRDPREIWRQGLARLLPAAGQERENYLRLWVGNRTEVAAQAEKIFRHRFDLLGSGETQLGGEIDWRQDFKSGRRWPLEPAHRLPVVYPEDSSDIKVVWELSRFQHLPTLGKAYWLTGEERFGDEFRRQLSEWFEKNPPGYGPNWMMAMETALRAVNWLYAANFFLASPSLPEGFWHALLKSLFVHGWFIRDNLEWNPYGRGNHYLADLVGLIYLGGFFRDSKEGRGWFEFGVRELGAEIDHQVRADGVAHEASIAYHRLDTELFLAGCITSARAQGAREVTRATLESIFGAEGVRKLEAMLEFILHYTRPDGRAPSVGDADDGRLLQLVGYGTADPADHQQLLCTGALLFDRDDFRGAADDRWEEAWWLLGRTPPMRVSEAKIAPGPAGGGAGSRAFSAGGFYVMRAGDIYALIRCGDVGLEGVGAHAHCDQLSFELAVGTQPLIIDPGSYVYTADLNDRFRFRSTASHNTLRVGGAEQNRITVEDCFRLPDDTRARLRHWRSDAERDEFAGEHFGYVRLPERVVHRRTCVLDKRDRAFYILDHLLGRGQVLLEWFFHLAPGVSTAERELCPRAGLRGLKELKPEGGALRFTWALRTSSGAELPLFVLSPGVLAGWVEEGWAAPRYGVREKISALTFRVEAELPTTALFVFDLSQRRERAD